MKILDLFGNEDFVPEAFDLPLPAVTANPAELSEGGLYFHLPGVRSDSDLRLPTVMAKHPIAIVAQKPLDLGIPVILVPDARRAYARTMAKIEGVDFTKFKTIGVTGTCGKTTTASVLCHLLRAGGRRVGFIGTGRIEYDGLTLTPKYYTMTTPDPPLLYSAIRSMQDAGMEYLVMEVSSHAIALEKIEPIPFALGLFTNLSPEHLDFHPSMEDYYEVKKRFLDRADLALVNTDDAYGERLMLELTRPPLSVGVLRDAAVRAEAIHDHGLLGVSFLYRDGGLTIPISLSLPGLYNVYNATLATAAALRLGVGSECVTRGMSSLSAVPGRMEKAADTPTVYIDYAHTEDALRNALKTIYKSKIPGQKIITVFGCGGDRDTAKRPAMAKCAEEFSDLCVVTSDNCRSEPPQNILSDIVRGFTCPTSYKVIPDRETAIGYAIEQASDGDVVLIAGKGHERYQIDRLGIHDFDERQIISAAVEKRRKA